MSKVIANRNKVLQNFIAKYCISGKYILNKKHIQRVQLLFITTYKDRRIQNAKSINLS